MKIAFEKSIRIASALALAMLMTIGNAVYASEMAAAAHRNLLQNDGFRDDLRSWQSMSDPKGAPKWVNADASREATSGSVHMVFGELLQCVPATELRWHRVGGKARVSPPGEKARVRIELLFLSSIECSEISDDTIVALDEIESSLTGNGWRTLESELPSGPGTRSALVKLVVLPGSGLDAVDFDDVFLVPGTKMESVKLVTPDQYAELRLCMTFADVIAFLGTPLEVREKKSFVSYRYDPQTEDPMGRSLSYYVFLRFDEQHRLKEKKLVAQ